MKFSLAKILLLAAGVSCAPPLELDTSTTTTTTTTTTEAITTAKPTEAPEIVAATTTTGSVVPEVTEAATEAVTKAVVELVTEADIITGLTDPGIETEVTTVLPVATTEQATATTTLSTTTTTTTTTTPPPPPPRLSGKEREALIGHLGNIDLRNTETLVLSPRQRLAISQELEYQQLGLPSFTDPTPWQRLSRSQQEEFNKKYLALSPELQEFSKGQFTNLPDDRQEHAFNMFIQLDLETLSQVISNELARETELREQQRIAEEQERQRRLQVQRAREQFQQGNRFQEVPRSQ